MDDSMMLLNQRICQKSPCIVATGFTTAYLGDERTLREFIVGDYVTKQLNQQGQNTILYLINDNYDALNYRQLRIAVNKNEKLLKQFEKYCGQPIAEIPDPFGCHESYSQHFTEALTSRLHSLAIHPVVLDTYQAYRNGSYSNYISLILENYTDIQRLLADNFDSYSISKLFHAQCPKCHAIDITQIRKAAATYFEIACERCETRLKQDIGDIQGKLSWKLDCAARWNLYGIDIETFSKAHLAKFGSFTISQFISQRIFGGQVPTPIRYGDVKISHDLSNKLLEIIPPDILKALFTDQITRDMEITKDSLEHFCHRYFIKSGLSYIDYILKDLPKETLCENDWNKLSNNSNLTNSNLTKDVSLISCGNRFSKFYYHRDYTIRLPNPTIIAGIDQNTTRTIQNIIHYALSIRNRSGLDHEEVSLLINTYLQDKPNISSKIFRSIRRILGQPEGPKISTLLSLLPKNFLNLIYMVLSNHIGDNFFFTKRDNKKFRHLNQIHQNIRSNDNLSFPMSTNGKYWAG